MSNIIIWSKDNCLFCDMAKSYFEEMQYDYEERKIGEGWTKDQMIQYFPDAKTVPQIVINEQHIGGYTDLIKYVSDD